jgi:uncharacterized damage-inducible protein DinB
MGAIADSLIAELDRESKSTERILAVVPADKLNWAPHTKSMALGQLAWHIASLPKMAILGLQVGERDIANARPDPQPDTPGDMAAAFRKNVSDLKDALSKFDDATLMSEKFAFKNEGAVITAMPKGAFLRTVLLNHGYHHRGHLTVYLRLLEVPVPAMYGRSADENMFVRR